MSGSGRVSGTVGPCSQSVWYSQPFWVLTSVENHCQVKYQSIWEKCGDACDLVSQEFLASLSVRLCFLLPASCDNLLRPNIFSCPLVNAVAALYETVTDVPESWVWWRADFQSDSRVLKKVLWTFSYLYLWHTMWFHAKRLLKTLKFWKSLNSLWKSGSRPQKLPKKAQKTDHSIAIYSNFWIGMVYFGCHLVIPHVQTVQNMYGKGG